MDSDEAGGNAEKCDLLSAAAALYVSYDDAMAILRSEALLILHSKQPSASLLCGAMVVTFDNQAPTPWLGTVKGVDMQLLLQGYTVDSVVHDGLMLQLQDGSSVPLGSLSNQPQLSSLSDLDLGRMVARINWQAFSGEILPMCRYVSTTSDCFRRRLHGVWI